MGDAGVKADSRQSKRGRGQMHHFTAVHFARAVTELKYFSTEVNPFIHGIFMTNILSDRLRAYEYH